MKTYFDCWAGVAAALFSQALVGEPELAESLPKPLGDGAFAFAATLAGDAEGDFTVLLDGALLAASLLGEGMDQKAGWSELVRETIDAAAGELLARTGKKCRVISVAEAPAGGEATHAFQLRSGERAFTILVRDEVRVAEAKPIAQPDPAPDAGAGDSAATRAESREPASPAGLNAGLELLLDVELETSLRFGSREMPLGEILDLGPGDVVELDRHVADPVDLIVGDKIVARGEVVLVNGNFGLRVTEVAAPRKRLESIRCLF